jgi:adenine-specific DNA-methyltransferase
MWRQHWDYGLICHAQEEASNMMSGESAKALGSFYTNAQIADFLIWWAIRSAQDTVLDPSFGGGVFLRSACTRLIALGGHPTLQVFGVEISPQAHTQTTTKLLDEFHISQQNLRLGNFFALDRTAITPVDVVVGNPPFIRYQRFAGETRKLALTQVAREGVRLTQLSSSWAPFVIHSIAMLKPAGRLAMVVPMEIGHASYARPVLDYLSKSFGKVTFLTFRKKLFPDLNEETLLLLAENKGACSSGFQWRDLPDVGSLAELQCRPGRGVSLTNQINANALSQGHERLVEYFIPNKARELYRQLKGHLWTQRLGAIADVGIGYVTGANDFFHLSLGEAQGWGIPDAFLRPAVRRSRALSGLCFTGQDLHSVLRAGEASLLLSVGVAEEIPESVRKYLEYGAILGVPNVYKCRTRSPWFHVPHVYVPDAFLSYMSGAMPRLVANDAKAVAPNTLHVLRLHAGATLSNIDVAALWQTSLTQLSVEIEGHALGGGMLKLEPTEAENIILASGQSNVPILLELGAELNDLLRNGHQAVAQAQADRTILKEGLGLSERDCNLLRRATDILRNRRGSRSAAA